MSRVRVVLRMGWIRRDEWSERDQTLRHPMSHLGDKTLYRVMDVDRVPAVGEHVSWDEDYGLDRVEDVVHHTTHAEVDLGQEGEWSTQNGLQDWLDAGWAETNPGAKEKKGP